MLFLNRLVALGFVFGAVRAAPLEPRDNETCSSQQILADAARVNPVADERSALQPGNAADATAFALVYGSALENYIGFVKAVFEKTGVNSWDHQRKLAAPSLKSSAVERPNHDTFYSRCVLDLTRNDVVLTVPKVSGTRFYIYPFYDVWSNQFASLGNINNTKPGDYLITYDPSKEQALTLTPGGKYLGTVNFVTPYGFILNRILLEEDTPEDIKYVHGLQNKGALRQIKKKKPYAGIPKLAHVFAKTALQPTEESLLALTSQIASFSPPEVKSDAQRVRSILNTAGLTADGKYATPDGVNLTCANDVAKFTVVDAFEKASNFDVLGNGWINLVYDLNGNFKTHYSIRAGIAKYGYGELEPYQAQYPAYPNSNSPLGGNANLNLPPNGSYIYRFSAKPPVKSKGFWSLTLYGANQYFVPNPVHHYALGDRSALTYPDGEPIYGPKANPTRDDEFEILIQPADIAPPKNWTENWLPGPAGGGTFTVNLRWYGPTAAFMNGDYVYPTVTNMSAITE